MEEMMMVGRGGMQEQFINPTLPLPTWKLYYNPFYTSQHQQHQYHRIHLALSARKLAATLWDLTFFHHPPMHSDQPSPSLSHRRVQSELDLARARIQNLKSEIEFERKMRKKAESLNKRLAKELAEEKKGREETGRVCEELANEIVTNKAEIDTMKREMEEERKMLRIAEVWREERVQMKLAEAKLLMEKNLSESKGRELQPKTNSNSNSKRGEELLGISDSNLDSCSNNNLRIMSHRKASPEPENPHIKRGIKGFVEFQRVLRAVGSRGRQSGSKLECQKAQLRLLLRHKSSAGLGAAGTDGLFVG
ncbi:protein BRANCHLESS TRICHOME-like [Tasmannia lanceolata]|uniref:protein BRANCHLESS TRICHOME-like n=1 Tax=Tasmannia lanceolata TaxID=3420 RepID=UPI004062DF92